MNEVKLYEGEFNKFYIEENMNELVIFINSNSGIYDFSEEFDDLDSFSKISTLKIIGKKNTNVKIFGIKNLSHIKN